MNIYRIKDLLGSELWEACVQRYRVWGEVRLHSNNIPGMEKIEALRLLKRLEREGIVHRVGRRGRQLQFVLHADVEKELSK